MLDPILLAMMISDLLLTFLPDHQSDPLEVIFIPKKKKEKSNMKKKTNKLLELVLQHKPKAALNILGSGFSHPTSEDITTASILKENQGKKPSIKDKIACLASLAWVSREITYCIVKVQQQRKCLYGHMLPQLEGGLNDGSQKQYFTISFMSIIYLLTSQEKNQLAPQRK